MKIRLLLMCGALCFAFSAGAQGFVNKMKQKAADAAEKALERKATGKDGKTPDNNSPNADQSGRPANKGGGGLISTPPDVNNNLADAEIAYKAGKYGEARSAVQQAMLGVEMEIGHKVLKSMPDNVSGLAKDEKQDQVTSAGYNWAGLTIVRVFRNEEDKELRATVANNSAWMTSVNMYLANSGYAQSTGGEQNWKQTKVKGHKAIIEYDEYSGYKLSVPLGQSSLIMFEGVNFASEQEMMSAANTFDIDGIKNMLGEK